MIIRVCFVSSDNTGRDIQKKTAPNMRERLGRDLGQGHAVGIEINIAQDLTETERRIGGVIATADHTDADLGVKAERKVFIKSQDQTNTGMNYFISYDYVYHILI